MRFTTINILMVMASSSMFLSGCSVLNTAGDSSFSCPGLPQGITCKTPSAVYKSSNGELPVAESDLPMGMSPSKVVETERLYRGRTAMPEGSVIGINNGSYRQGSVKTPLPVRSSAQVMRIWIAPWVDKNDDLHLPSFLYTEVASRKWNLGESEFAGNGVTVPYRVIEQAPGQSNSIPNQASSGSVVKSSQQTSKNGSFNSPAEKVQAPDDLNLGDQ